MAENKENKLLEGFPKISTEEWKDKIKTDLKGADFDRKLVWKAPGGLKFQPFYREEDLEKLDYLNANPGDFPFVRGNKSENNNWQIRQDINVENIAEANKKALDALAKGADAIAFNVCGEMLKSQEDFSKLVDSICLESVAVTFACNCQHTGSILAFLEDEIKLKNWNPEKVNVAIGLDPIGALVTTGNYPVPEEKLTDYIKSIFSYREDKLKNVKLFDIHGSYFADAGANTVQELAYTLAMGSEYMNMLTEAGFCAGCSARSLKFSFGVGANYFMEIAKFRAARLLWAKIAESYNSGYAKMFIHAENTRSNKSLYDPYVNMLRVTTENMSAVIAGVDSFTVLPFNDSFEASTGFSERIARNTQLVVKEEAHLDYVVDPAAGSYYIENLTNSIAEEAWKLFVEIEEQGGFVKAFKEGTIQAAINENVAERKKAVATRKEIVIGTNQYPNFTERIGADKQSLKNPVFKRAEETIAEPLTAYRTGDEFEQLRLQTEKSGKEPKVFMLTYGNVTFRRARALFTGNFFACAGYDIIDNNGFATIDEGVEAARKANADIVVVCSADDEYPEIVPQVFEKLNGSAITVVAGYPKDSIEMLQEKGIKHFIHVKSNVLESLQLFNKELGIN